MEVDRDKHGVGAVGYTKPGDAAEVWLKGRQSTHSKLASSDVSGKKSVKGQQQWPE